MISVVTFEPADEIPKCDPTRVKATEKYFTAVLGRFTMLNYIPLLIRWMRVSSLPLTNKSY